MVKKHQTLEQALEDYAQTIHQLANSSRLMVTSEHPERSEVTHRPLIMRDDQLLIRSSSLYSCPVARSKLRWADMFSFTNSSSDNKK